MWNKDQKQTILTAYAIHGSDTGSPEVQIALLTHRVASLSEHFQAHKKDHHSRRGFMRMISQRRKLLNGLKASDPDRHKIVVERLSLKKKGKAAAEALS